MPQSIPKPNTQALSWFYGEQKKNTLILDPKYQRNPIWSIGQKCFLIDSLLSGCPIPQVFINIRSKGSGRERQTIYEIVDGQQRLRAILEFMDDQWALISTTARSYPVSEIYTPHIGKKFSELPEALQEAIWNYQLAVQELRDWDDLQIRALFRRLNYVVERLNKQELRHSQYFGQFVEAVEQLAKQPFWDQIDFFSRRDSQRMKDIEFVSELFAVVIDGVQEQQKTLDQFYADFDVVFPKRGIHVSAFRRILASLVTISDTIQKTRFIKKADFYGLFAAVRELVRKSSKPIDLLPAVKSLKRLSQALEQDPAQLTGNDALYYSTVIEGANKLAKRQERTRLLEEILRKALQ